MSIYLTSYFLFIAFFTGASLASYMNVMVYRIPLGMSVAYPASACPNCNHKIRWYENVPVFSWLFLKGKCSSCNEPISAQYVLTEFLFGAFTASYIYLIGLENILKLEYISFYLMVYFLLTLSLIDLRHKLVPISLLLLASLAGVLSQDDILQSSTYFCTTLGIAYMFKLTYEYIRGIEVLGEGDLPIIALYGSLFGLDLSISYAMLLAALIGLIFILIQKKENKELSIPFVPALSIALVIVYFYENLI